MGASLSLAACSGYGTGSGDESTKDGSAHDEGSDAVWIRELTAADTILLTDLTDSSLGEANGRGERTAEVSLLPYGFARTDTSLQTNVYSHSPRDRSVGLDHMGARFYAPELGVWTSGDPAILTKPEQYVTAEFGAANAYAYANLRPVVAADRDGQFWHVLAGAAAGGLIGGTVEVARQYFTTGKVEDFGRVGAAAAGGAVSGAMVAANPVASLASVGTVGAGSNVAGGVVTRLLQSGGQSAGTVNDVAIDAGVGLVTAGVVKGGSSVLRKVAQKPAVPASGGAMGKAGAATKGVANLLASSEAAGGHLVARHVGQSAAALDARIAAQANVNVASSFQTLAEAQGAVASVLSRNAQAVSSWANAGASGRLVVNGPFSGGLVRVVGGNSAQATGARIVLQGNGSGGYHVLTGFPVS